MMGKKKLKTCFVVIGYGLKTDYLTGRVLDLDKTFENIIKPVCNSLNLKCFRAKDIGINGVIDLSMYTWLYQADVVIADISTLNANALYELGVRHALRPFSTLVISEDKLSYPFDVEHTVIDSYEHLGKDIGASEARRFKQELRKKLKAILTKSSIDSPVYTFLGALQPPKFIQSSKIKLAEDKAGYPSIAELLRDAEKAKDEGEYSLSASILAAARKYDPNNEFILQRLALVTYKAEKPNKVAALKKAFGILRALDPEATTDTETLGLCGAIFKRLFDAKRRIDYLRTALRYYEKGFYIKQDYYNGINAAYLYDQLASIAPSKNEAIYYSLHANRIREKVVLICKSLMKRKGFSARDDKEWIVQTLYQAEIGNGRESEARKHLPLIKKYSKGRFDQATFREHLGKLLAFRKIVTRKYKIKI